MYSWKRVKTLLSFSTSSTETTCSPADIITSHVRHLPGTLSGWSLTVESEALSAELLKPTIGGEEKEILKIADKRRMYTIMREDPLIYQVNGPARIELITRYPSPEKSKKSQPFSYQLVVDGEEPIKINHRYKLQKSIRSVQHPSHYYTYSGNYFINIKDGDHTLTMSANADQKYPV